ncbi:uncharacterized protein LOC113004231 isoform X2 [Solenopsis invicta]|uniref:uncharacterized protein LOC113004231 isoform X2 n=1 Tax=Solenopsis invicta TaxID=13686 RepID=UPI00193E691D|nr:uncharacterized protein LOC113004231 isoform X2 [Solenopsis invicta]
MSETDKELLTIDWEGSDQSERKVEEIVTTEETSIGSETDRQGAPEKVLIEDDQRRSLLKNSRAIAETNNIAEEKASLELHGVTCQVKRREKPAVEKLTWQSGTAEARIDDKKAAEFEENIEMVQKSAQVSAHKIKKSPTIFEKGIQINLRKSEKYRRYGEISHIDAKIRRSVGLEKKGKKEEGRQEKWINKYKQRKQRESDGSSSQRKQKACHKGTLVKEKLYNRRKREKICNRGVQTHTHPRTWHVGDPFCGSRAERHPDDTRQRRIAPALRSTVELRENRQTQCNLRDRKDTQSRKVDAYDPKSTNKPEVWSCRVQPQFKTSEQTVHCQDYVDQLSSPYNDPLEKKPQQIKKRYDVNVRETRLEVPMLKKYLPAYQAPGLIEELKEHDRMRLIQEREARRWIALSALRSTRDSPSSSKSRDRGTCGTSVICDETVSGLTSVSTRSNEGNTLPYQETQTFKQVLREFRQKIEGERPLIFLSQRADNCKELQQLFPPKNESREGFTVTPKFEEVANRFKPICDKQEGEEKWCTTIYEAKRRFQSDSVSEVSSICSYCEHRRFDVSTSTDETADNNVDIS